MYEMLQLTNKFFVLETTESLCTLQNITSMHTVQEGHYQLVIDSKYDDSRFIYRHISGIKCYKMQPTSKILYTLLHITQPTQRYDLLDSSIPQDLSLDQKSATQLPTHLPLTPLPLTQKTGPLLKDKRYLEPINVKSSYPPSMMTTLLTYHS